MNAKLCCALLGLFAVSSSVSAAWQLASEQSFVHFITTKNTHISEVHQFKKVTGQLSDEGHLQVQLDLASVDTGIAIRDQRMRDTLFQVADYPQATLTAQITPEQLALEPGNLLQVQLPATLTIKAHSQAVHLMLTVARLNDGSFLATTRQPLLISASDFALKEGVDWLQEVAKLSSIDSTVPVTFSVLFRPE